MDKLPLIEDMGYRFYFNYTIMGLPEVFENRSVRKETGIEALNEDHNFHTKNFKSLAAELEGYVEQCIISFVLLYEKVKKM